MFEHAQNTMETLAKRIIAANSDFHSIQIEFLYNSMQNRYQHECENRLHVVAA